MENAYVSFNKRALCTAYHDRPGRTPERRLYSIEGTAGRQGISEKYLEGIIKILVKDKMLTGVRGKGGGYKLTKSPDQYTVGSILRLTEGSLAPVSCLESPDALFLRAHGLLPYTPYVERLGSPDQQLLRQYHSC